MYIHIQGLRFKVDGAGLGSRIGWAAATEIESRYYTEGTVKFAANISYVNPGL